MVRHIWIVRRPFCPPEVIISYPEPSQTSYKSTQGSGYEIGQQPPFCFSCDEPFTMFKKRREAASKDEAQNLASKWIKQLETSLLARVSEHDSWLEENSDELRNQSLESSSLLPDKVNTEFKPVDSKGAECVGDKRAIDRFCVGLCASKPDSLSNDQEKECEGEAEYKPTPRVDLDVVRQKRLEYFQQKSEGAFYGNDNPVGEKNKENFNHSNSAILDTVMGKEVDLAHGFNLRHSSRLDSDGIHKYSSPGSCDEDDDIRLDLWGLKDAVKSGEIDLKPYIHFPEASSSDGEHMNGWPKTDKDVHVEVSNQQWSKKTNPNTPSLGQSPTLVNISQKGCFSGKSQEYENTEASQPIIEVDRIYVDVQSHKCAGFASERLSFPKPQITGSEIQSSEGSLVGCNMTSSEVCKTPLRNAKPKRSVLLGARENKDREKRGKEKILNELAEFIRSSNQPSIAVTKTSQIKETGLDVYKEAQGTPIEVSLSANRGTDNTNSMLVEKEENVSEELQKQTNYNFESKGALGDVNTASLGNGHISANKPNFMAKICLHCNEINSKVANWCIECGSALIRVKPSCLTVQQRKEYEKQCKQVKSQIWETLQLDKVAIDEIKGQGSKKSKEKNSLKGSIEKLSREVNSSQFFVEERHSLSPLDYKRRWQHSSIAWSSYDSSELSKPSSLSNKQAVDKGNHNLVDVKYEKGVQSSCDVPEKHHGKDRHRFLSRCPRSTCCSSEYAVNGPCNQPVSLLESAKCQDLSSTSTSQPSYGQRHPSTHSVPVKQNHDAGWHSGDWKNGGKGKGSKVCE